MSEENKKGFDCPCQKLAKNMGAKIKGYMPKTLAFIRAHKTMMWAMGALLLLVVFELLACPGSTGGKVGVLDIDRLRGEAAPYKTIAAEQKKYEEIWKMKFTAEKEILDKQDQELAARQKKMKPAELKRAVAALQKEAIALQQKYQVEASKIMAASASVRNQVDALVLETARVLAKDAGYTIVLPKGITVYAGDTVDMTDEFIKQLDKKSVKVTYPDPDTLTPSKGQ